MDSILQPLGIGEVNSGVSYGRWIEKPTGEVMASINPTTGKEIAEVMTAGVNDYELVVKKAQESFLKWRMVPAPRRGEIVRQIGEQLRANKQNLGKLISLEMGKILPEGLGEIQEMIDMADFAVGLSRQLYGLSMHSERPSHRMYEQWHPLGVVGVVTAFNFPAAVWAWNTMIAAVCGDTTIWKPSSLTPLTAIAVQKIVDDVFQRNQMEGVMNLVIGQSRVIGDRILSDRRIPLISVTGSCKLGKKVANLVGERFGRCILELGGNNGVIVMKDANLDLATRAILFGAIGTAGQRCTTIRRLFLQNEIASEVLQRLCNSYRQIKIGDPLQDGTLMGPLVSSDAVQEMVDALETIKQQGGKVLYGGKRLQDGMYKNGFFVEPTIVEAPHNLPMIQEETFAPILYVVRFSTLEEGIAWHNDVPQGLSSSIFTNDLITAETFLSHMGSDCGIANVNIGTSGAEIGGAFGGEKDTGGGREAGSDSWKAYMRRQTTTINWGKDLPLSQGIQFGN